MARSVDRRGGQGVQAVTKRHSSGVQPGGGVAMQGRQVGAPEDKVDAARAPVNQARHLQQCSAGRQADALATRTASPVQRRHASPSKAPHEHSRHSRRSRPLTAPVCRDRWNARSMPCRWANTLLATPRMAPWVTCTAGAAGAAGAARHAASQWGPRQPDAWVLAAAPGGAQAAGGGRRSDTQAAAEPQCSLLPPFGAAPLPLQTRRCGPRCRARRPRASRRSPRSAPAA